MAESTSPESRLLNRAQHAALAIALRGFESSLRQVEAWLRDRPIQGTLCRTSLRMSPETRGLCLTQIRAALRGVARLADRFGLQASDEPLENKIAAAMSVAWADLIDSCSDKMARYGPVDARLGEALDADLEDLAGLALSISSLATKNQNVLNRHANGRTH